MKPGPTPKPTKIKELQGNPGKRALNKHEPQFETPTRMIPAPDFLDAMAADIWRELGKRLLDADLFTMVDKYALAMFCVAAGRWIDAEKKLKISGPVLVAKETGNLYQNPYLHVANRAWDQMRVMFGEFGLTPAERSRLVRIVENAEEDSLAGMLSKMVGIG